MPYTTPDWAKKAQEKYDSLIPSLGGLKSSTIQYTQNGGLGVENLPMPGTFRQEPDIGNVVLPSMPKIVSGGSMAKASGVALSRFGDVTPQTVDTGIDVAFGQLGAAGTLLQAGQVTLRNVGEFLQKADPSSVGGMIKATVQETWGAGKRMLGAIAIGAYMLTDPVYRKYMGSRIGLNELTPQEQENFDTVYGPAMLEMLKQAGFSSDDFNNNSALFRRWVSDLFTLETSAATLWTGGSAVLKTAKGVPMAISSFNAGMNKKIVTSIVDDAFKKGITLTVDSADNVFATASKKFAVQKYLGLLTEIAKPGAKVLSTGLALEAVNAVRKYIDPDTAERIARDQRQFVDSLSTGEMLALDLGIGLLLPLEIPGLLTLKNTAKTFDKALDFELGSKAFYKFFGDPDSSKILNKLAEFSDLQSGIGADHAVRATLINHTLTVMEENGISPKNIEHFTEIWESWMKAVDNPDTLAYLRRLENEGTKSQLSWFSNKLGRALTPSESLQHWFVTAMDGKFVGDVGEELTTRFDDAVRLATTGIPETTVKVTKTVTQFEKIKEIAGKVIKLGDTATLRDSLDVMVAQKGRLLSQLQEQVETLGYKLTKSAGKIIVPKDLIKNPEVRKTLDAISDMSKSIDNIRAEGLSKGIPADLLATMNNSRLLDLTQAYTKFAQNRFPSATIMNVRAKYSEQLLNAFDTVKSYAGRYSVGTEKILSSTNAKITDAIKVAKETLVGSVLAPGSTDDELVKFILSFPTKADEVGDVGKKAAKVLTQHQQDILKMREAISNFDKQLASFIQKVPNKTQVAQVSKMITEIRNVEAQLPRGMFVPEVVASHFSRWGKGVTAIPLADLPKEGALKKIAEVVANLQDANGVTRAIADYLVPHNPADIYVKAMNRLESAIETLSPGQKENILRDLARIQDQGISLIPVLPGGGPKWEALGKPMVTGLQWRDLDRVGAKYGINGFGKIVHESFIESMTVSGIKPGIIDRMRAAPGIGAIYDSLYKQYMLTRFAINPMFHLQQVPETALIGIMRSFNLPADMSADYIKAVTKLPVAELDAGELTLFNRLRGDLVSKVAKKGSNIAQATQETKFMEDLIQSTGLEERKRLRAFIAEFPVQLRGALFDMPVLNNTDPLMTSEFRDKILKLMNNPSEINRVIGEAYDNAGSFDPWYEGILRAVRQTNTEVQKLTTYNLNRSALEKDLHALLFPFSFGKKTWSEISAFVGGGSVARPVVVGEFLTQFSDFQENPTMMEIRAKYPTLVGWIYNMSFVNPQFPLVNLQSGNAWFGGLRGSPAQAILFDTLTDGKYDITENPESSLRKLGGGGAKFWLPDGYNKSELGQAFMEIFRQDSDEQQRNYLYLLRRLKLEKQVKEETKAK